MEKNHPGHGGAGMGVRRGRAQAGLPDELEYGPGGLAVLYAEENTRDSLFAAMQQPRGLRHQWHPPGAAFLRRLGLPCKTCAHAPDMVAAGLRRRRAHGR